MAPRSCAAGAMPVGDLVLIGRALEGLAGQARAAGLADLAETLLALGLETSETARHITKLHG